MSATIQSSPRTFSFTNLFFSRNTGLNLMRSWVGLVVVGQLVFAIYIVFRFGLPFLQENLANQDYSEMIKGFIGGDSLGNSIWLLHILPVTVLCVCGVLQLLPVVRQRYPNLHRWSGRVFIIIGMSGALTGLWLTWVRDTRFTDFSAMGITLNGLLIPIAAGFAWYYARQRKFSLHKRWAIHTFILVNGVWTLRLMFISWFVINQGPNGNSDNMDGPTDIAISYACYLFPMFIAEMYFWAQRKGKRWSYGLVNFALVCTVLITFVGIGSAVMLLWLPEITAAF